MSLALHLDNIGKRFGNEWVFRNVSTMIPAGGRLAILGGNGSGKSTLMQIIAGFITPAEGQCTFTGEGVVIAEEKKRLLVSFAAPYLQLIEDFTVRELIRHIGSLKPFVQGMDTHAIATELLLERALEKPVKQLSSGMKQRLRTGLAILADTPLLLLDEPVSNLDREGISWYRKILSAHAGNRIVIVSSNEIDEETFLCDQKLMVTDYKMRKA